MQSGAQVLPSGSVLAFVMVSCLCSWSFCTFHSMLVSLWALTVSSRLRTLQFETPKGILLGPSFYFVPVFKVLLDSTGGWFD